MSDRRALHDRDALLRSMWRGGETSASIAAAIGIKPASVRYRASLLGLPPRGTRGAHDAAIVAAWDNGLDAPAIARRTGLTSGAVLAALRRLAPDPPLALAARRDLVTNMFAAGATDDEIAAASGRGVTVDAIRAQRRRMGLLRATRIKRKGTPE